jgi:hypothetical protein
MYANDELFIEAVAGGERAFMKMLANGKVTGKKLFDQMLYPLDPEQEEKCCAYKPVIQDFDAAYKNLNVISRDTVRLIKGHMEAGYPNSTVVTINRHLVPPLYKYRHVIFFKVLDYKEHRKYRMLPRMAAVKVCGRLYAALDTVNVYVEAPVIMTIES